MNLVTRCPHCDTSFRVTDEQLAAAQGAVRCGACLAVFSAPDHLVREIPAEEQLAETPAEDMSEPAAVEEAQAVHSDWAPAEARDDTVLAGPMVEDDQDSDLTADDLISPDDDFFDDDPVFATDDDADEIIFGDDVEFLNAMDEQDGEDEAVLESTDEPYDEDEDFPAFTDQSHVEHEPNSTDEAYGEEADGGELIDVESVESDDAEPAAETADDEPFNDLSLLEESLEQGDFGRELDVETPPEELIGEYQAPVNRHYLAWISGCVLLLVFLAGQVLWFNRNLLAQNPDLRGYYESACRVIGCDLPVYRDMDALHVAKLVVRSDPGVASALAVDAIIRNDAPWRQYFPDLRLRFSGIQGNLIADRTFKPGDYLGGEMTGVKFIPANTEVRISLEIVDPGPDATNYSLIVVR